MGQEFSTWKIWRHRQGSWQETRDRLIEEAPVRLVIEGCLASVLMATPGRERELAAGFALTMGWARPGDPPPRALWDSAKGEVRLSGLGPAPTTPDIKSCGGGPLGPDSVSPVKANFRLEQDVVLGLTAIMAQGQGLFASTGASHAAALFDGSGEVLSLAEDAGRHNALDKAVGGLWLEGRLDLAQAISFSGRMSLEMVLKAARAGLGIMVGVSAPTAPAVRVAQEAGVTLGGFSRGGKLNIYTHPWRIRAGGGVFNQER